VGAAFFARQCTGRAGHELVFRRDDGQPWQRCAQDRPMRTACAHAKISPRVNFHALRHTWASLSIMAGMPLLVAAQNLGHADVAMVQRHYGHLTKSYVKDPAGDGGACGPCRHMRLMS
jgi:integrase